MANSNRRSWLITTGLAAGGLLLPVRGLLSADRTIDPQTERALARGLEYLAREQRRQGSWEANGGQYKVAMTALAGISLLAEGSTTTRGKYSKNVSRAVNFVLDAAQPNGLIGYPDDFHYTYGHGFSMLFLSQVFGEEEDAERRRQIRQVLERAVRFSGEAQTTRGGWGYISALDGNDFDEGSTCITQVQALRACRNAGIVVPREIIDRAKKYIHDCLTEDGGVQYSIRGGGARPAITAAAVAAMFSAGDYGDSDDVRLMLDFCKKNVWPQGGGIKSNGFGHWHYLHFYYAQVMYRDTELWEKYLRELRQVILSSQGADGSWADNQIGNIYVTSMNLTILQLDKGYLPIYQR
ncbi:prenyltransferase/squalene oxidase repeat-containing protein [Planctomicrobium sp. SH664]|uniref:prenyltransferase/squalene oxidase repeat-containing protein n=1 Tax=Planctomicrobium sp. SH664 TaxID=3448125 RepID=UPI003F5B39E8